jgi:2-C-methyl-D-erythritol 2,4-cyclodiphosphate synthase
MEQVLGAQRSAQQNLQHPQLPRIAIGEGMDVHALVPGRPLILGGVTIPHHSGLLGHSDADALLHAITDALLGAAGMGDIGRLFPDTDAAYAGADSQVLLQRAYAQVAAAGWQVSNVDATIVAQAPKMAAHIPAMQANIARCLDIDTNQVNVKAKTNERLGWLGREEGIETRAVLMLQRV